MNAQPELTFSEAELIELTAPREKKERHNYGGGYFEISRHGVNFVGSDKDGNEQPPKWLCDPLHVLALTRDDRSGEWGRLLEWLDADDITHQWAMPMELLEGDGGDMRRELARQGLNMGISKAARDLMATYIKVWPVKARARCVQRLGWYGAVFVTPGRVYGDGGELVVFQNTHAMEPALSQTGSAEEWREQVAALARGNTRLMFAICTAFAATLADIAGEDSGGFHFRGASSCGKSTALKVAASVWGNPTRYMRLWRATANGLEGLAALHNDGLLILDEISQCDPREAGAAAYMLANGQGKTRAGRTGTARQAERWRLLLLSSGEESLAAMMQREGKRANAGQEIRLADIEADAGAGMGLLETLHHHASPAALAQAITDNATRCHGSVGLEWLRLVVHGRERLPDFVADGLRQFCQENVPEHASGQIERVARRFALVAVGGELASHWGLTGWAEGEAASAVAVCFSAWLAGFGGSGNREERQLLEQVRAFFESHGASRFESIHADDSQRVVNRAGYYRNNPPGVREYLVLPEAFKRELCKGFDAKAAAATLVKHGWIEPGKDGKSAQKPRLPGIGPTRCYVFTGKLWEAEE